MTKKYTCLFLMFLLPGLLLLHGCGFQLRGTTAIPIQADSIYLQTRGARDIGEEVRLQLEMMEVRLVEQADEADYIVSVSGERLERHVLSVSPRTGKVEEYELVLGAELSVRDGATGKRLVTSERISAERDFLFDETAVVSGFEDQRLIREELARRVAYQILLRLQSVTTPDPGAATAATN